MNIELSDNKINEFKQEFISSFEFWAVTRKIFDVSKYSIINKKYDTDDFVRIGLSQIIDRYWFTADVPDNILRNHGMLGDNYGKSIAFGEVEYIVNELNTNNPHRHPVKADKVVKTIDEIIEKSPHNDLVILTNFRSVTKFIGRDNYQAVAEFPICGYYKDTRIPMYITSRIKMEFIYVFNKNMGNILVKEDATISVSELRVSEYEKIKTDIPKLADKNLFEYVRIRPFEIIKYINNPNYVLDVIEVDYEKATS